MQIAEGQGYIKLTRLPIKMVVAIGNHDKLDITRSAMAQSLWIFVRQIVTMFIASGADNVMDAYDEENADDVLRCFGVSSMTTFCGVLGFEACRRKHPKIQCTYFFWWATGRRIGYHHSTGQTITVKRRSIENEFIARQSVKHILILYVFSHTYYSVSLTGAVLTFLGDFFDIWQNPISF